jgi:predicted TIM-barrel fold metal-dependent hydrolase
MFGTDNPFFPPDVTGDKDVTTMEWPSTTKVYTTMQPLSQDTQEKILRENAQKLLGI